MQDDFIKTRKKIRMSCFFCLILLFSSTILYMDYVKHNNLFEPFENMYNVGENVKSSQVSDFSDFNIIFDDMVKPIVDSNSRIFFATLIFSIFQLLIIFYNKTIIKKAMQRFNINAKNLIKFNNTLCSALILFTIIVLILFTICDYIYPKYKEEIILSGNIENIILFYMSFMFLSIIISPMVVGISAISTYITNSYIFDGHILMLSDFDLKNYFNLIKKEEKSISELGSVEKYLFINWQETLPPILISVVGGLVWVYFSYLYITNILQSEIVNISSIVWNFVFFIYQPLLIIVILVKIVANKLSNLSKNVSIYFIFSEIFSISILCWAIILGFFIINPTFGWNWEEMPIQIEILGNLNLDNSLFQISMAMFIFTLLYGAVIPLLILHYENKSIRILCLSALYAIIGFFLGNYLQWFFIIEPLSLGGNSIDFGYLMAIIIILIFWGYEKLLEIKI